ncbi:Virulence-associated protein I [Planktothrix sp. PCC 11201]|uniref:HigA family addiction module antitoxin n=1 Tax=Planktothrix sp. PCC 11201 TaxID=1729650 RepID=UPI00091AE655|nr:HigA family addiction module antitoxin [Planktothrix sp. PCC 11201]SKB13481.1 Virulence-associated protein I [Planktothrix sp. PCC 11201]
MLPQNRIPAHPGKILSEEFIIPLNLTPVALAEHLRVPVQQINEIVKGKQGITPETAWLLAQSFQTSPEFWMNLQIQYDLALNQPTIKTPPIILSSS